MPRPAALLPALSLLAVVGEARLAGECPADAEEAALMQHPAKYDRHAGQGVGAEQLQSTRDSARDGTPYEITQGGNCSDMTPYPCEAPGWVYCQDAVCDQEPVMVDGVLVAKCLCWAPSNTNSSILPTTMGGASCVANTINSALGLPQGGEEMCKAMKSGSLISTYGPTGWKPPLVVSECPPQTPWAWCWGAPCSMVDGDIICDCPMMISAGGDPQFLSVSIQSCANEADTCKYIHNGSPSGGGIQGHLTPCGSPPATI